MALDDADLRFSALQRGFVAGLPARWSVIVQSANGSTAQRAELHRLAGAAGSFGYTSLGQAAGVAERCDDADMNAALLTLKQLLWQTTQAEPAS